MTKEEMALSFRSLAYRDYIAARILFNNGCPLQGLTLASSSVEKYIKIALSAKGLAKSQIFGHLDKLDKLQALLAQNYFDFTGKFDPRFLELLGKAYTARYYDDLKQPLTIGFFVGQLLCELDFAVNIMEQIMTVKNTKGEIINSSYQRAASVQDQDLIFNNYIFQGLTKKAFMELPHQGFAVHIDSVNGFNEIQVDGRNISNTYEGTIADISIKFQKKSI
jgi:hypothetical protein